MMWTIAVILLVLWVLGMVSGAHLGWWVHLFLVLALLALIVAVVHRGRYGARGAESG
jgi:hypothetical protein